MHPPEAKPTRPTLMQGNRSAKLVDYSDAIDIYDSSTNQWSSVSLSEAHYSATVAVVGSKVLFAGGGGARGASDVVGIYDSDSGSWSAAHLSAPGLPASSSASSQFAILGTRALFWGGLPSAGQNASFLDIYDVD